MYEINHEHIIKLYNHYEDEDNFLPQNSRGSFLSDFAVLREGPAIHSFEEGRETEC
jgi:hypothetical protein